MTAVWYALFGVLFLATVPGSLELLLITVAGALPSRRRPAGGRLPVVAVVIPAHDEAAGIARGGEAGTLGGEPQRAAASISDRYRARTASQR